MNKHKKQEIEITARVGEKKQTQKFEIFSNYIHKTLSDQKM